MTTDQPFVTLPNGAKFPLMGLGTYMNVLQPEQPDEKSVVDMVETALEIGYRNFDTAQVYNTETGTGKAIANKIKSGLIKRSDVFVTTKVWRTNVHKGRVIPSLEKSLKHLGFDYVDLLLIHWPTAFQPGDVAFPRDSQGKLLVADLDYLETWKEMEDCVDKGLTKAIGISNFNSKQIQRLLDNSRIKPANNQIEIHPFLTNRKLIDFCQKKGISVSAYTPLAGLFPEKREQMGWPTIYTDETIGKIAKTHKRTPAQVALRFIMQQNVVVLPKSSKPDRLRENFEALHFELTKEEMAEIEKCNINIRICDDENPEHRNYPFNEEF